MTCISVSRSIAMFCLWFTIAPAIHAADPQTATFKVGFAERDIMPDIGMEQPGGYGKSYHQKLHDPCKVRAVVFDDGQSRVALVGVDALLIRRPQVLAAREGIKVRAGIAPEAVLISASHSHSSGPIGMVLPGEFDDAPADIQKLAYEKTSMANAEYLRRVEQAIIDAVCEANEQRVDAKAGVGYGIEDRVAYNRRFRMQNGLSASHPRQGNPDIIEPAGPTDPQVGVLGAWNAEGKMLGCVVNFACHATTSPGGISANYIHYLEQTIRGTFGQDVIVVFLPGCCGDVTQVDNLSPYVGRAPENWARYVGGRVGAEAVKVLLTIEPGKLTPVGAKTATITLERRKPSTARLERCRQLVAQDPKQVGPTESVFAKEILLLDAVLKKEPVKQTEVQAVQVGPLVLISNPAEFFCEFGLRQKQESGFPITFPVELANDCAGYVPTAEALGPRGGGYETRLTYYSNLEPKAGDKIAAAGIKLAREFKPTPLPEPAKAPPFKGTGWDYGNLPPELD